MARKICSWRTIRRLSVVVPVLIGASVSGCSRDNDSTQPAQRVLRAGVTGDLRSLEPYRTADANYIFIEQIFDQLLFNERNQGLKGEAVTDWVLAPDNMSMTLKLRPDLITHDGSKVDAAMIKWAIDERIVQAKLGAGLYIMLAPYYKSCRILGPYELKINFSQPTPHAPNLMSVFPITDPDMFVRDDGSVAAMNQQDKQIGTGAFRFVDYVPGSRVVFERFDQYWDSGLPKLDRMDVRIFSDAASMVTALEVGEIDYAFKPPFEDAARLRDDPRFTVHVTQTQARYYMLFVNPEKPELRDSRVRQAINYAIDREGINAAAFAGMGAPTSVCFPPDSLAYRPDLEIGVRPNVARAQALLAAAGSPDIQVEITVPGKLIEMLIIAQILAANLEAIGIEARVALVDQNVWIMKRVNQDFDLLVSMIAGTNTHPARMEDSFVFRHQAHPFFDDIPPAREYVTFQEAFKRGMAATDDNEARQAWQTAAKAIIDGAWSICLASVPMIHVTSSRVKGFTWNELDMPVFKYVELESP